MSDAELNRAVGAPCEMCAVAKRERLPFPASGTMYQKLQLVSTDLSGKLLEGVGGVKYWQPVIDASSGYADIDFVRTKGGASAKLQNIVVNWETQTGVKVKNVRFDNGREYITRPMAAWLADKGINHQWTNTYSPQQNGQAERYIQSITSAARTALYESWLPETYGPYAVQYANLCKNMMPGKDGVTPYQKFWGKVPDVSMLRVFGSRCIVHVQKEVRGKASKFQPRGEIGRCLGLATDKKGYVVLIDGGDEERIVQSRDVVFDEPPSTMAALLKP